MKVMRLNTIENSRRTLASIIREFHKGKIDETTFRALVYGMSKLLEYFRIEKELQIEERLDAIEDRLEGES
jgi:hypothetical protein